MTIDLTNDIKEARSIIEPVALRLRGLGQLWHIFFMAHKVAIAFFEARSAGQNSMEAHLVFTKALVIDYGKPFTPNRSQALEALDKSYLKTLMANDIHGNLLELRHKMVAHIDDGFETQQVVVMGTTVANNIANPKRLEKVFVGMGARVEMLGAPWWLDDTSTIEAIRDHIAACAEATGAQIRESATLLVKMARRYGHVFHELEDLVAIQELEGNEESKRFPDQHEGEITAARPIELQIGRQNVASMVTRYDSTPEQLEETRQNGFRIILEDQGKGMYRQTVSFLDWQSV